MVRESNGVLRDATWEERDRMMQVYYPSLGRKMWLPHMLTDEGLIPVLDAGRYKDILDRVYLQCDPDSADYIRVRRQHIFYNWSSSFSCHAQFCRYIMPCMRGLRRKVLTTVYVLHDTLEAWSGTWSSRRRWWA